MLVFCLLFTIFSLVTRAHQDSTNQVQCPWDSVIPITRCRGLAPPIEQMSPLEFLQMAEISMTTRPRDPCEQCTQAKFFSIFPSQEQRSWVEGGVYRELKSDLEANKQSFPPADYPTWISTPHHEIRAYVPDSRRGTTQSVWSFLIWMLGPLVCCLVSLLVFVYLGGAIRVERSSSNYLLSAYNGTLSPQVVQNFPLYQTSATIIMDPQRGLPDMDWPERVLYAINMINFVVVFFLSVVDLFAYPDPPPSTGLQNSFNTTHETLIHYFQRYNGIQFEEVTVNFTALSDVLSLDAQGLSYVVQPDNALETFHWYVVGALESTYDVIGATVALSTDSDNLGSAYKTFLTNILDDSPISSQRKLDSILTDYTTVKSCERAVHADATRMPALIGSIRVRVEKARHAQNGIHPGWNKRKPVYGDPLLGRPPSFEEHILTSAIEHLGPLIDYLISKEEQYGHLLGDLQRSCAAADTDMSVVVDAIRKAGKRGKTVEGQMAGLRDWAKGALAQFQEMEEGALAQFQEMEETSRTEQRKRGDMFTGGGRGGGGPKTMFSLARKEYKTYWAGMSNEQYEMYLAYWQKNGRIEGDTNAPLWAPLRSTLTPGQEGELDFDQMSDAEYKEYLRRQQERQRAASA
ncbi:hypothetical protein BDR22DRAFT_893158 [Usnea florida]